MGGESVRPEPDQLCLATLDNQLLLRSDGGIPTVAELASKNAVFLDTFEGSPTWLADAPDPLPDGFTLHTWPSIAALLPEPYASLAARAMLLARWRRAHQYCGACREELADVPGHTGRVCPACGLHVPVRLAPVALVAIRRGGELLLIRHGYGQQQGYWALVGGYVEPGETLEQAAEREVREEVGLPIHNLRYAGGQAWGLSSPDTLLVAFTAEAGEGEPVIDTSELTDARWFPLDALPPDLPPPHSRARHLIESLRKSG